jgi:chromosome segregation ATPase
MKLLKLFNRRKMEIEQIKQENEGLKAQIAGLSFNLQQADKQIVVLQNELEKLIKQNKELTGDAQYATMKFNNTKDKNDSRYY